MTDENTGKLDSGVVLTTTGSKREYPKTVDSTSDERTVNNVIRHEYRVLTDTEKEQMRAVKDVGKTFYDLCTRIGDSRELSLAKTRIEEAVMWTIKHVTK